jgi:DNA invertase Pin-like site-specific DNA recombinase
VSHTVHTAPDARLAFERKSTDDPNDSTGGQRAAIDTAAAAEDARAGRDPVPVRHFAVAGRSAFRGRIPELEEVKRACEEAVARYGRWRVELWCDHSDRFARGDGVQAAHLVQLVLWAREAGVTLRSVKDDGTFRQDGLAWAAMMGDRANEDSRRKGGGTVDGLHRRRLEGAWLGGRLPDGYLRQPKRDREPTVLLIDPQREATYEHLGAMLFDGLNSGAASRDLNANGLMRGEWRCVYEERDGRRVKVGERLVLKPWTPWRVRQVWRTPHYAGLQAVKVGKRWELVRDADGRPVRGNWPAYFDADQWLGAQGVLDARAAAQCKRPGGGSTGRTSPRHVLARLPVCGWCGGPMHSLGDWVRKDGTVIRRYHCAASRDASGTCFAPRVDAPAVERKILGQLDALTLDLHGWVEGSRAELRAARAAWEARADEARAEVARLEALEWKVADDYLRRLELGEDDAAEAAAMGSAALKARLRDALARLAECEAQAEAVPDVLHGDALLDLYAALQRAVSGHVQGDTVQEVNARLREALDRVVLTPMPDGSVRVRAYLSDAFLARLDCAPDAFAAVSALNGGPRVIRDGDELAADLSPAGMTPRRRLQDAVRDDDDGPEDGEARPW